MVCVTACPLEDAYGGFGTETQQRRTDPPPLPTIQMAEDESELAKKAAAAAAAAPAVGWRLAVPRSPPRAGAAAPDSDMSVWWPFCAAVLAVLLLVLVVLVAYLASAHASLVRELRYMHAKGMTRWV